MERVVGRIDAEVVREAGRETLRNAVQTVETIEQRNARYKEMMARAQKLIEISRRQHEL
jgi:hypothetical protein